MLDPSPTSTWRPYARLALPTVLWWFTLALIERWWSGAIAGTYVDRPGVDPAEEPVVMTLLLLVGIGLTAIGVPALRRGDPPGRVMWTVSYASAASVGVLLAADPGGPTLGAVIAIAAFSLLLTASAMFCLVRVLGTWRLIEDPGWPWTYPYGTVGLLRTGFGAMKARAPAEGDRTPVVATPELWRRGLVLAAAIAGLWFVVTLAAKLLAVAGPDLPSALRFAVVAAGTWAVVAVAMRRGVPGRVAVAASAGGAAAGGVVLMLVLDLAGIEPADAYLLPAFGGAILGALVGVVAVAMTMFRRIRRLASEGKRSGRRTDR
ncbi:hypothetical protein WIS52_12040 [Pseudonocardia nematodicida]|uniref:Uncharacterized protein n=1 Tax=Pseudonocardia nematodicida TaxID=1206997 RepID=A0ABV1K9P2_9PSEU